MFMKLDLSQTPNLNNELHESMRNVHTALETHSQK